MMLKFFPYLETDYKMSIKQYGELLEIVVIEDVFMPEVLKLLQKNENVILLKRIFEYFEEVSNCGNKDLLEIFSVTVLEILGNDRKLLEVAKMYMGPKTNQLQIEADRDLGRI